MRRFVAQNKIWAVLVSALLLPVLLVAVSESELDDVAAMVTNAKKAPNTMFIIDTSESMNSFAYSDYIEACEDAQHNADHAYDICQVSLKQCQDVKSEAGCVGGSIDCSSIQNNCNNLNNAKTRLRTYCNNVKAVYEFPGYPNENRRMTGSSRTDLKERFVGPWNPDAFYKDDICFYDWTSDTNGDVLNDATSEHWSNKSSDSNKWTTYEDPDTHDTIIYKNTDRSDWDCITDGNDNMSNGQSFSALDGVSGFWLNWKYATSLDAVKILLANAHEFSYPPRSRGENKCLGYYYKPFKEENDTTACDSAEHTISTDPETGEVTCAENPDTGLPYYGKQKVCFISPETGNNTNFDTAYLDKSDEERENFLRAWKQLVAESWKYTEIGELEKSKCAAYSTYNDFSLYDDKKSGGLESFDRGIAAHPNPVSAATAGCGKCMVFNGDSENPAFLETECKEFVNQDDSTILRSGDLGEYKVTYHQECCKTSKCTNPKCRDNDLCCKDNAAAFPSDDGSEGYNICRGNGGYSCELGFYSEFDQDMTHCCDTIECVSGENGESENELDPITGDPTGCKICKVGTVITQETVVTTPPESGTSVLPEGYTYSSGINLTVLIDTMSGPENIEDMTVSLYSECNGVTPDSWSFLASFTCHREGDSASAPCADYVGQAIMNPPLSGCENSGYKVKIVVSTTGRYCKMEDENFSVSLKYQLPSGSFSGSEEWRDVFDPEEEYFMILRNESVGGANNPVVQEYECKTAFYHTQAYTDSSSCPRDQNGIVSKFHSKGYPDVRYCDPSSRRQESFTTMNGCSVETTYICTYLCRDELTYDEPWNCMAFFYQMDEMDRGGLEKCSNECMKESGIDPDTGDNNTEKCCRCIDANYYRDPGWTREYDYFEPVDGVTMPVSEGSSQKKLYHCAVSGIMGSDTQVGWHAEIVNGHIKEVDSDGDGVKDGTYLLTPYKVDGALFSPYEASHWLAAKSFITQKQGDMNMKDTTISAFKTASTAQSRENVCIYEVVENWGGDMCSVCSTCSFGCVDDPSISIKDDKCAYPSFWMKVPQSDGGELILSKEQLQTPESITNFQNKIKKLKAVGGPTLGETLYDAWRFLGGMYAVYDPNHRRYNYDYKNKRWDVDHPTDNPPYESPFSNQDPVCFSNEVVVFSGGQAQFDHNDKITQIPGASKTCDSADAPCVKHTNDAPTLHKPYYETDWYQTSIEKVSTFVKTKPFYNTEVDACAKTTDLGKNIFGYTGTCATPEFLPGEGKNKPVINKIHSGAIGEWTLSALYNTTQFSYLDDITKKIPTEEASEEGKYCSLTLSGGSGSCSFQNITDVLMNLLNNPQNTDVNSGRPHWTSSLVQPYDVEEKYRGPEAYVAGTVPIAPATSRFWFGNLKKYMIDEGDTNCNITVTSEEDDAGCGGWKKQTFKSPADCFSKTDMGGDISDDEFKRLMAGGAARRLSDTLREGSRCSAPPCFKNVNKRKIYYDDGSSMKLLKNVSSGDFERLLDGFGGSVDSATAEQIFDYMYGYDAFATSAADRIKLRFGYDESPTGTPLKVLDPVNIDFNQSEENKIEIRPLLLGAIVHSKPLAVYYGTNSSTRIYAGANDGMLHAFDELGNEKWAYIPTNALPSIAAFATSTSTLITFNSTVDGPITLLHIDQSHDGIINGDEKAYLIFGYRRGAQGYTVIDVTDPDNPQFVQNLNTDGGYSFGKAVVFRKCNQTFCSYANQLDYYLAVPGGYDTCADGSSPACKMPEDASDDREPLKGNKFAIYKFNTSSGKFDTTPVFNYKRNSSGETDAHKKWLVASFASTPFAINTSGKGAVSTEFVYFTDLTGTVFRVNVSDSLPSNWSAKVVFAKRNAAGDMGGVELWGNGKSYVGNNFFPPLEKYNPGNDPERIPIPVTFGDASWPKVDTEKASMTVFYDIKPTGTDTDTPYSGYDSSMYETSNLDHQNQFYDDKSGWRIDFGLAEDARGEKGITDPMLVYDFYGSKPDAQSGKNGYSLAWNTYIPKRVTDCKNFGTSFNYERLVIDGSQALSLTGITGNTAVGEWNPANCQDYTSSQGISIATAVGVVATNDGYDLTFGAGADIYRKQEISVLISSTRIIKWYELY